MAPALNRASAVAAATQAVLALYLQVIEWVDLFPWNNVRDGNGQEAFDVAIGIVQAGLIVGAWKGKRWLLLAGVALYAVWLGLQLRAWWVPYFWGATEERMRHYTHWFGETHKFLPPIGDHPIPDSAHVVLQFLMVAALAACIAAWTHTPWSEGSPVKP